MAKKYTTKWASTKQEKRVAKEISGKQVVASGSMWGSKGDVRNSDFLIECKTTKKDFYTLNICTWKKIEREAIKDGLRTPLMCIDLENGKIKLAVFRKDLFPEKTFPISHGDTFSQKSIRLSEDSLGKTIHFDKTALEVQAWEDVVYEICKGVLDYVT